MTSNCEKCSIELKEEEEEASDIFQCDLCESWYHNKCEKVMKKDVKAKKESKRLRIFCKQCEESQEDSVMKKVLQLLKVVYKIDLTVQERKPAEKSNDEMIAAIANKINTIDDRLKIKLKILEDTAKTQPPIIGNKNIPISSYAKIVQSNDMKPAVVIKPKQKQHSKKTMEEISKTFDKSQLKVCSTRNVHDGGIVLCCNTKTETMKVKEIVREKLGDGYEVMLPKIKNPRIRITNIDPDIADESIIPELKKNNEQINDLEMELVTVIPKRIRGTISNDIVVEVKSESYQKLLEMSVISLPWRECQILEHFYIKRCFKCCGFSHIAQECRLEQVCSKCSGSHRHNACRSNKICCFNCKTSNEKYNLNLDTKHHAWSKECAVIQRRMSKLRNRIEFNKDE